MENLKNLEPVVTQILIDKKECRNSDTLLYLALCGAINKSALNKPYEYVMTHADELGFPVYESVCRVRRRVQAENEDLRATVNTRRKRAIREELFKEWATNEG